MSKKKDDKDTSKATKTGKLSDKEHERLELLQKAGQVRGRQLTVDADGQLASKSELKQFALGTVEKPSKNHEVYYRYPAPASEVPAEGQAERTPAPDPASFARRNRFVHRLA